MRKLLLALCVFALLTAVAPIASAQNEITLGGTSNTMTFVGNGSGGWTLSFPGLTGTAFGTGVLSSGPSPYSITQGSVTITGTSIGADKWSIGQSGGLSFSYAPSGTPLLTGSLQLVDLSQSGSLGNFDYTVVANLTNLGGSLSSDFTAAGAVVDITILFASATDLASLGSGGTLAAGISSGEIFQTPEPVSMVLVGSGLLMLGGLVRRRRAGRPI